ncbi:HTH-type transcriptional regulator HdfR [Enterobacteriaceae bacterium YMB-R22]|uniref:HTH-type transcriptional regulator HdfR n=1 Tax=Tenebrionicola larvae TaxID=2815733 RepID=UPI002012C278|nr:HTH-type transcriptional regulator HdfR [Tenebrionicola larvae]MBV4414200.1 HTH-type transcriptional regulator HdfR [Tenebrionicola larvae]
MDTELLKTFLEVSKTRHFGRAAEALYLTQSAVSFRIRQLENQLGVNLFTRHRNNIRLTSAGERLLPYAETLMSTWLTARKDVSQAFRHNEFSIGASASVWECMLSAWLRRLYYDHKGMQFEARIAQRQSLVKQLHERRLDLLITTEAPKMDELGSQIIGQFNLALYCIAPARSMSELTYLRLEWGQDFQQYETGLLSADDVPALTTSSVEIAAQLLPALEGCTWLPTHWAEKHTHLAKVNDSLEITRPLYAIWLQNSDKLNQVKAIIKTPLVE